MSPLKTFPTTPEQKTASAISQLQKEVRELRRTGGGGAITFVGAPGTGGGTTIVDATTVVKGKIRLAGHFAGTADTPIIAAAAAPQVARLGLGVAADATAPLLINSGTAIVRVQSDGATLVGTGVKDALNRGAQQRLVIGPHQADGGYFDATAGGLAATGAKTRILSSSPYFRTTTANPSGGSYDGFRNGVNTSDSTANNFNNLISGPNPSTYWMDHESTTYFDGKGLFVQRQMNLAHLRPQSGGTAVSQPNNYSEAIGQVVTVYAKNRGGMSRPYETGIHVYTNDGARTGEGSSVYHADAGPANAQALGWFSLFEHNEYATYDDATIFGTTGNGDYIRPRGAAGMVLYSSGTRKAGTAIHIRTNSQAGRTTDATTAEAGWVRALTLEDKTGTEIFCLDGFGNIGLNLTRDHATYTSGLPAKISFAAKTVRYGGMDFVDAWVYRSAASTIRIDNVLNVNNLHFLQSGGQYVNAGTGGNGYMEMLEQSSAPSSPAADRGRIYVSDDAGTTILAFKDSAGTISQLGGTSGTPRYAKVGLGTAPTTFALAFAASTATTGGIDFGTDLNLYRQSASVLRTDHSLSVGTNFRHTGSAAGSAVGFFAATPIVRPAAYTQTYSAVTNTHAARTTAALTDNTTGTADTTLEALTSGTVYATDVAAIRNNFADLAAMVNAARTDSQNTARLVNQILDDLQAYGLAG